MVKSKRFEPIRALAANSANELSRAMADAARRVAELERQHEQLKGYREQYVRQAANSGGSMDAVRLQNYRAFLDRLTEVLQLHVQKLGVARAEYESRRGLWSQKRIEAETLGRAVERFRGEERRRRSGAAHRTLARGARRQAMSAD
jgi:flagellar export protein FliJ